MNSKILYFLVIPILLVTSCKKEITNKIIEVEEKPALDLKIYGVWQNLNYNPNNDERKYIEYLESGYQTAYFLYESGLQEERTEVLRATDKLVTGRWGQMATYKFSEDTLSLYMTPNAPMRFLKSSPDVVKGWVGKLTVLRTAEAVSGMNYNNDGGVGIDGDFLYFWASPFGNYNMYKYNTLTQQLVDSFSATATEVSVFYDKPNNRFFYASPQLNTPLVKTAGFNNTTSAASSNSLPYIRNITFNGSSGTIYAFSGNNRQLYAGTDGGSFSSLFDFAALNGIYIQEACYYKNDEFLISDGGRLLAKVKIAPNFSVIKSYPNFSNFNISSISTNGTDVWVYGENYNTNKYEFRKIKLED